MSDLYDRFVNYYKYCQRERGRLKDQLERITGQLCTIDNVLADLNDLLCKSGVHIYEHFEENGAKMEAEE